MEDDLDKIANGNLIWHNLCENCYSNLTSETNKLQDLKKFSIKIDENHTLIIGKHGPVVKYTDPTDNKKVSFLEVNKKLVKDNLNNVSTLTLEEVLEPKSIIKDKDPIGKYKGQDLFIKKGKFGIYAQWGKETKSLKEEFDTSEDIQYIDVIRYLEKETGLNSSTPIGLIRELNNHLSLRTGKYGDYIFYKKPRMKTPKFYKLNGFDKDYKKCDKIILMNWIKETYKVE